ncbi:MAG: FG-GAP repeat domain-containing protein [Nannocystaceae bacterium]|nr:VCBS repeat-containing protein [bacterium]
MRALLLGLCIAPLGCLQPNPDYLGLTATGEITGSSTTARPESSGPSSGPTNADGSGGSGSGTGEPPSPELSCGEALCFAAVRCFETSGSPFRVGVAEIDGDGHDDVVTLNDDGSGIEVWLAGADGSIASVANYGSDVKPLALAAIDADQDGLDEIAVGGGAPAGVVLFDPIEEWRRSLDVEGDVASLGVADADGDGVDDLAFVTLGETFLSWARGGEDGSFELGDPTKIDGSPVVMILARLGDDAVPDAVVGVEQSGLVTVFAGNDAPGFEAGVASQVGRRPYGFATADLNHDGEPEVVLTSSTPGSIDVLVRDGELSYASKASISLSETAGQLALADFDRDGQPEIVVAMRTVPQLRVYAVDAELEYADPVELSLPGNGDALAVGDFDADGQPDVVATVRDESQVCVVLNDM